MAKILGAELIEELAEATLDVLGPSAALSPRDSAADFEQALRQSPMFWIVGGTNDIQRNLVARGAGLPRSTPPAAARPPGPRWSHAEPTAGVAEEGGRPERTS